jgi:hypothetical protein
MPAVCISPNLQNESYKKRNVHAAKVGDVGTTNPHLVIADAGEVATLKPGRLHLMGWRVWGRERADYTARYPELEVLRRLPPGTLVDGELVAFDADSRPHLRDSALLVARLQADLSFPSEAARVQAFIAAGGGCRATFYHHARRVRPASDVPKIVLTHKAPIAGDVVSDQLEANRVLESNAEGDTGFALQSITCPRWRMNRPLSCRVGTDRSSNSQITMVPSTLPEASRLPLGENASAFTASLWRDRRPSSFPTWGSQT